MSRRPLVVPPKEPLFSYSRAEEVLQQLVDTTERQGREIDRLRALCDPPDGGSSRAAVLDRLLRIDEKLDALSTRQDAAERSTIVPGKSSLTAGEAVAANRRTVARALGILSSKADVSEVQSRISSALGDIGATVERLRGESATDEALGATNGAIAALADRVEAMSADLRNKVDNASLKGLAADASAIRNHAAFVQRTDVSMEKVRRDNDDRDQVVLPRQQESIRLASEEIRLLRQRVEEGSTAGRGEASALAERVSALSDVIEGKSEAADVELLKSAVEGGDGRLTALEESAQGAANAMRDLTSRLGRRLDEKYYDRDEVDAMVGILVRRDHFVDVVRGLREDMTTRAGIGLMRELEGVIGNIAAELRTMKMRVDLTTRFVEWYGERGDAYERNIEALDICMKGGGGAA